MLSMDIKAINAQFAVFEAELTDAIQGDYPGMSANLLSDVSVYLGDAPCKPNDVPASIGIMDGSVCVGGYSGKKYSGIVSKYRGLLFSLTGKSFVTHNLV